MRKPVRAAVGVLSVLLVAVGCGGGSATKSTATTVAKTDPSSTKASLPVAEQRSASQFASDKAEAERVVLRLTDLPPRAWTGKPDDSSDSPEKDAAGKQLGECMSVDPSIVAGGAKGKATADSDDFEDEGNHQVSNSVTVVSSRARASEQLAVFKKAEFPKCFETYMTTAIKSKTSGGGSSGGATFGAVRVTPFTVPGLNAESVSYRISVPVSGEGQTLDALIDMVVVLKGRTGVRMTFTGIGSPFPPDLETSLTNKIIDRAPAK